MSFCAPAEAGRAEALPATSRRAWTRHEQADAAAGCDCDCGAMAGGPAGAAPASSAQSASTRAFSALLNMSPTITMPPCDHWPMPPSSGMSNCAWLPPPATSAASSASAAAAPTPCRAATVRDVAAPLGRQLRHRYSPFSSAGPPSTRRPAWREAADPQAPLSARRPARATLAPATRSQPMPSDPDLQAIVDEIHAELAPRFGAGRARRLHPAARPGRPAALRHRGRHPRRHGPCRRRRRRAVLDPEHLQGLPADARARQARRERSGATSAASPRAPPSTRSSSSSTSRAGRATRSSTPARSSSPTSCSPATRRARRSARSCASCASSPTTTTIAIDAEVARSEAGDRRAQRRARPVHALLRPADPPGRPGARRLLPPLRHRDELPPARAGRPLPRRRRPRSRHRQLGGAAGARPADQRADADLRPLRRLGRLRLPRRPARQERRRRRHPRRRARPRRDLRLVAGARTPPATRSSASQALEMLARRTGWSVFG